MDTQIEELTRKYQFFDVDGKLGVRSLSGMNITREDVPDQDDELIRANKPALLQWVRDKAAREAEELQRRLAARDAWMEQNGVHAIEDAICRREQWEEALLAAHEREDGLLPARYDGPDPAEVMRAHPVGAAYVRMSAWAASSHYRKMEIGMRACDRLLAGEDHAVVLAEAEAEWKNVVQDHMWD